jgi:hypothetical protein
MRRSSRVQAEVVMRRILGFVVALAILGGSVFGARIWVAQDTARCALVYDFVQPLLCTPEVIESLAYRNGKFEGTLDVRFMSVKSGDGHAIEMVQLLKPFAYKDSNGVMWEVPEGFLSDGASIPDNLWTVMGGPYSGPYRDAAVIHDYFCHTKTRSWEAVHKTFLEAALNRGTPEWKARYMYAGILLKGPRWPEPKSTSLPGGFSFAALFVSSAHAQTAASPPVSAAPPATGKTDAQIFQELQTWIEKDKPTLAEIRKRVDELRAMRLPQKK